MARPPCCSPAAGDDEVDGIKKGPWTPEEDRLLLDFISKNGCGKWRRLPKLAGLNRCGKSCRLRWTNYLRPDIRRGSFSDDEEALIIHLHSILGNKWSAIAAKLPGRTDNEIKNYWNTHLRKKLLGMGIDPVTHRPRTDLQILAGFQSVLASAGAADLAKLQADAANIAKLHLVQGVMQVLAGAAMAPPAPPSNMELMALFAAGLQQQPPPPPPTPQQSLEMLLSAVGMPGLVGATSPSLSASTTGIPPVGMECTASQAMLPSDHYSSGSSTADVGCSFDFAPGASTTDQLAAGENVCGGGSSTAAALEWPEEDNLSWSDLLLEMTSTLNSP